MPSVASEVSAVRHAHQGQGPRSSAQSADSADQTSPFAALLDGTSDSAPAPKAPAPAAPPAPSPKPAARPHDGQSASAEDSPSTQKPPSGSPAPAQTSGVASSPPGPKGNAVAETALGALAKKAAKDSKSNSDTADALTLANAADTAAVTNAADATAGSSTAAAVTDSHGDKTEKSDSSAADSSATDAAQATPPPVDPSANQAIPAVPLPVAVVVSPSLTPDAATTDGDDSKSGAASGPDAPQIAALSDAVAGAPRGKTDRAAAEPKNGAPTAGTPQTDGNAAAGAKAAQAARSIPSLTPQPPQKEPALPSGPSQSVAADAAQSRNADGLAAKAASTRQRASASQSTDSTAGPQDGSSDNANVDSNGNSNVDPKQVGAATATEIADIAQQALDKTARRVEAPANDTANGGILRPETVQADGTQPSPDGASGLIAPAALTTAAAPAAAAAAAATTINTATAVPINGLAVEIAARAQAGKNRFEIRLDPPELGRINVRLEVDHDGKVTSHLVADRQETLYMLRRDAPALERSLQDAGLKTADNALQFSLRDQGAFGGQNQNPNHGSPADAARVIIPDRELPAVEATTAAYGRLTGASLGIDIRV